MARPSRRHQRGFIIFGWRTCVSNESLPPVETICPACRRPTRIFGKAHRQWFTLYFIPVIPMSAKTRFTECGLCKAQFRATIDEFRQHAPAPGRAATNVASFPAAIALYNELRDTPTDSEKLLRLMHMYIELESPEEAVSAARAYPQALQQSDQCLTYLAAIYQRQNQGEYALRCVTAALALNPNNAQAHDLQDSLLASSSAPA